MGFNSNNKAFDNRRQLLHTVVEMTETIDDTVPGPALLLAALRMLFVC